jgi:hypothetical protein
MPLRDAGPYKWLRDIEVQSEYSIAVVSDAKGTEMVGVTWNNR